MTPREFFPNMPDDVFDMWLAPFIEQIGWPFSETNTDTTGTRWQYLLGIDHPLSVWRECNWSLVELDLHSTLISHDTMLMIDAIIANSTTEAVPALVANLENTKERFWTIADFIKLNGVIPKPIIGKFTNSGAIDIVDGNHRVAASLYMYNETKITSIQAWVPQL